MTVRLQSVIDYYADRDVRERIREYFGAESHRDPSAARVASLRGDHPQPIGWERATRRPASQLVKAWREGGDVARSLRDHQHLLFFIELDYDNPDAPGFPFLQPDAAFAQIEPAYRSVMAALAELELAPLVLVTGRGYHFVGRLPLGSPVITALARLAPAGAPDPAWAGLGCVIEYLAHKVLQGHPPGGVPLVVNGVPVGPGAHGRAAVSLDFSYVGDPLDLRFIRAGFGTYQWHRFRPDIFGPDASQLPPLVAIPRGSLALEEMLQRGRTCEAGISLAREALVALPDVTDGVTRLTAEYAGSALAAFHRRFHARRRRARTPDVPADLPRCAADAITWPNDRLLKPGHLQHLTRVLLSRGWDASDVASLVQDGYEGDHGWGDRWQRRMVPAERAAFEVRVFAGLIVTGVDGLVDFNCVSAQEKGLCPRSWCRHDLRVDRDALLQRRP
jgi:hypothetical protein